MEYSLEFSQRLIGAARSFLDQEKVDDETGRQAVTELNKYTTI
jgi:hypothetical protein